LKFRYCLMISIAINVLGLVWFGLMLARRPADTGPKRPVVRIAALTTPEDAAANAARALSVPPGMEGDGRGQVGPLDRTGTYGEGGEATWEDAGPLSPDEAAAAGASAAAPGESGSPAAGPNPRDTAGLGGPDDLRIPSPHETVDPRTDSPPAPGAAGIGEPGRRPLGDLSPQPEKPSSVRAGQKGPGESAPGQGRPPAGDGSGPGAGPGPGGTATPGTDLTDKPGQPGGVGGGGGASGSTGGAPGGGSVGGQGPGGTGGGPGRGSAGSGSGTGGGGGQGPAAGNGGGGGGNAGAQGTPARTAPAAVVSGPPPSRTREMERLERHGSIRVKVKVDASGRPTSAVATTQSGYADYDRSAAEWVRTRWRFRPALKNGQPVSGEVTVTVRY